MSLLRFTAVLGLWIALSSCGSPEPVAYADESCAPANGVTPYCGFTNPEDLAAAGDWLIVGEMRGPEETSAGMLVAWNRDDKTRQPLWPAERAEVTVGDADCVMPQTINAHGIDVRPTDKRNHYRLLAINHRENFDTVEIFQLKAGRNASAQWQGCINVPKESYINDLAIVGDGLVATHMYTREDAGIIMFVRGYVMGLDTGHVLRWMPDTGWEKLPATEGIMPNGIAADARGEYIYTNYYWGKVTRRYRIDGGIEQQQLEHEGDNLDNITWTPDGKLLIASHPGGFEAFNACIAETSGKNCLWRFRIDKVEPKTMQLLSRWEHVGEPFGLATTALEVDGELWLGSFLGKRIAQTSVEKLSASHVAR